MAGGGIKLRVSPDGLKQKAKAVEEQIGTIEKEWNSLKQIVTNSKSYWIGEASNQHQKEFQSYMDDMEQLLKHLKEHPTDLMQMAGVYEESERMAVQEAGLLSGDVIS